MRGIQNYPSDIGNVLVMVLAGGKGQRLYPLTRYRTKAAVPFLGSYRLIDFTLNNCLNSGLRKIQILTQYKSDSLADHIRSGWNLFNVSRGEYIKTVPPQQRLSRQWYRGTADAVFQNLYMLEREKPDLVLILSGDHVYRMDYRRLIRFHREHCARLTVACVKRNFPKAAEFGVLQADSTGRVKAFEEKPQTGDNRLNETDNVLCSAGIYVFETDTLVERLVDDTRGPRTYDFGRGIVPRMVEADEDVYARPVGGDGNGTAYWRDIGTLRAFWKAHMEFCGPDLPFDPADRDWPIQGHSPALPPARFTRAPDGSECAVESAVVSPGATVEGATIRRSLIGPGVHVGPGASVEDSVLIRGVDVGEGATISKAVVDADNSIPEGTDIGLDSNADGRRFIVGAGDVVAVPQRMPFS